jgi:hypothetical protein
MACPVCNRISQAISMLNALGKLELDAQERKGLLNADGSLNTERYSELILVALVGLRHFCAASNINIDTHWRASLDYSQEGLQGAELAS